MSVRKYEYIICILKSKLGEKLVDENIPVFIYIYIYVCNMYASKCIYIM